MKVGVRYFSKYGRTKKVAESLANGVKVKAISITDQPKLDTKYDLLFLGGAPYANIMDPELKKYVESLSKDVVNNVVLFSTSNWSRRTIYSMKKILNSKGINVEKETFYVHMLQVKKSKKNAEEFSKHIIDKYKEMF